MFAVTVLIVLFFAVNLAIGWVPREGRDNATFLLAGRSVKPILMFATLAATNFSAYTVFGMSGSGYRSGWGMYPVMAFGTGLMAVSFMLVGIPLRRAAAASGHLSPSAFLGERFGSRGFGKACSALLIAITLPYVAAQAIAGGRLIAALSGMPYEAASFLILAVTAGYVILGGMRAVVKTDAFQLAVLGAFCLAAFVFVLAASGGFQGPAARPAKGFSGLPMETVVGFFLLWLLADPMFPHLAHRFQAAESERSLTMPMTLYPIVTGILFFLTIGIGVLGAGMVPGLSPAESENIFQRLAALVAGPVLGPLLSLAGLAALVSSLDSQLLALASMFTEDFLPQKRRTVAVNRLVVVAIALGGWLVALKPPSSVLTFLNATAFPGYAAFAPIMIAGLYSRKTPTGGAVAALAVSFALVVAETAFALTFGRIPSCVVNFAAAIIILVASRILFPSSPFGNRPSWHPGEFVDARGGVTLVLLSAIAAFPWWAAFPGAGLWGIPSYVFVSAACCAALSLEFARLSRRFHSNR